MTPQINADRNREDGDCRREGISRPRLPTATLLIAPVALGILLLGMAFQAPRGGGGVPQETGTADRPQPKPAFCNRAMTLLLQQEYRLYQRYSDQTRLSGPEYSRLLGEVVDAYNQVAGDTDPSAFAGTALPRHLDYPDRLSPFPGPG